jgi:hypothetical protein
MIVKDEEFQNVMNNQTIIEQYKEYANCIVGTWHNERPGEVLTFYLLENIAQEADLITVNNDVETKATYSIFMDVDERWYLQTYVDGEKYIKYCILVLSPNVMALAADENNLSIYMRKVDYFFVYDIIDKL